MKRRTVTIGITLGDVAGIGPEVAVKAALGRTWPRHVRLVLIGSRVAVERECVRAGLKVPPEWTPNGRPSPRVGVWNPFGCRERALPCGRPSGCAARLAAAWIGAAVTATLNGRLQAVVTAPINKQGLRLARIVFPGHTEMLARLTGTRRYAMMLIGGPLRVVLVTRHIPLAQVSARITRGSVITAAEMAATALRWLGVRRRTVGICALNPHGGDGGTMGVEERTIIRPAIKALRRKALDVEGPIPADVIFHQARQGRYGAVVAMYHDQGLGPLKMLAFEQGVNLTLGLPLVRTSPDHGTAYDIAGKGLANPGSMVAAIALAVKLAQRRNPWARRRRSR